MEDIEIINPEDKDYADGKLYRVSLWSGAGYGVGQFDVYATGAQAALETLVAYLDVTGDGTYLTTVDELGELIQDDYADDLQDYMYENPDADDFTFATEHLGYIYVDATMEGASQPYFIMGENFNIEEVTNKTESKKTEGYVLDDDNLKDFVDTLQDGFNFENELADNPEDTLNNYFWDLYESLNSESEKDYDKFMDITNSMKETVKEITGNPLTVDTDIEDILYNEPPQVKITVSIVYYEEIGPFEFTFEQEIHEEGITLKKEYYEKPDDEHIIWDSEFSLDDMNLEDLKDNQYQDYLDNFDGTVTPKSWEKWLDDTIDSLLDMGYDDIKTYDDAERYVESNKEDLQKQYNDYVEDCKNKILEPDTFEEWLENHESQLSEDYWEVLEEDLEYNILPVIENQINEDVLVLSGFYGSNYPDFKSSGNGGKLFEDGIDSFKDYMSGFDRQCITSTNGILGTILNDHDGTVSGQFYTVPTGDKLTELLKAMNYETRVKEENDEEDIDKYGMEALMEDEFTSDLKYGGVDAQDLTNHLELLVPIKDTISGYTSDTKNESKVKKSKSLTEDENLSVKDDKDVIVNKNQYGYNVMGIIIDNDNKQFQIVSGQTLPTGKYRKGTKKAINQKAEDLKAKGYKEVKGSFSTAGRVEERFLGPSDEVIADSKEKGLYTESEKLFLDGNLADRLDKETKIETGITDEAGLKIAYKQLDKMVSDFYDKREDTDVIANVKSLLNKCDITLLKVPELKTLNDKFNFLQVVRKDISDMLVDVAGYDALYETKSLNEDEDLQQVSDDIQVAREDSNNDTISIEQISSSLDVLNVDEVGAIDGYKSFLDQAKQIVSEELYKALETQVNEIIEDEEEHIDKLNTIKATLNGEANPVPEETIEEPVEDIIEESKQLTEAEDTTGTISEELNTGTLPVLDVGMYGRHDFVNDYDCDYTDLDPIVMKLAPDYIQKIVQKVLSSATIKPLKVYHPRQYNYSDDELEFTLTCDRAEYEALKEKALSNEAFAKFLKDNYKSYDGFISYLADDIDEFAQQEEWKQIVQVIMFSLQGSSLEEFQDGYSNDFYEAVTDNFGPYEFNDDDEIKFVDVIEESKKSFTCPQCGETITKLIDVDVQDLTPEELDQLDPDGDNGVRFKECPECGYRAEQNDFKLIENKKITEDKTNDIIKAIRELGMNENEINVISLGDLDSIAEKANVDRHDVMKYLAMGRRNGKYHKRVSESKTLEEVQELNSNALPNEEVDETAMKTEFKIGDVVKDYVDGDNAVIEDIDNNKTAGYLLRFVDPPIQNNAYWYKRGRFIKETDENTIKHVLDVYNGFAKNN